MSRPLATLPLILLLASAGAEAQTVVGERVWGANTFVEYVVGNAPIVISSGHGGYLRPTEIPDRTYGVVLRDGNTQEMARVLAEEVAGFTGRQPHLIISHLHRSKLDPNRGIIEAAQGDPLAEQAFLDFHGFIRQAHEAVTADWGTGLYLDVHGHGHPIDWTEIGYALTSSQLALPDSTLNSGGYTSLSTLQAGPATSTGPFSELLRGPGSLGGRMQASGYDCVPGPLFPSPGTNPYFNGGYNVRRHGPLTGGALDSVQFELSSTVRGTPLRRAAYAVELSQAVDGFLSDSYGIDPGQHPLVTVTSGPRSTGEANGTAAFRITRSGDTTQPHTVTFRLEGSALPGFDYVPLGTTIEIPAGQASVELTVRPLDDTELEGGETVDLQLLGGIEIGSSARASVLIIDDEGEKDLAAAWSFDRLSPSNAPDTSGNGHPAALKPTPASGPTRALGGHRSVILDEVDDHLTAADWPWASTGEATLAFWFRAPPSLESGYQYLFSHGSFGVPESLNVYLREDTGRLRAKLVHQNARVDELVLETPGSVMDGSWHHAVLVIRSNRLSRLYVDGKVQAVAHFAGDTLDPAGSLFLGGRNDLSSTRFFGGELDEVRLYGRALDSVEVLVLESASRSFTEREAGVPVKKP